MKDKEIKKYDIESIIISIEEKKIKMVNNCNKIMQLHEETKEIINTIDGFNPIQFKYNQYKYGDDYKKYINRKCWYYLVNIFDLKKYMLCTSYDKLLKDIEENNIPDFTVKNALGWVRQLKELIYENIRVLVETVFDKIMNDYYFTGGSSYYNQKKKKRNNSGINKFFILTTYDYAYIFSYRSGVTITDDLEKCLYILDNERVPEEPIKDYMRKNKLNEYENKYMKIKVCKNGNTHYWIKDENILNLLNKIGAGNNNIIGEKIRIKILN